MKRRQLLSTLLLLLLIILAFELINPTIGYGNGAVSVWQSAGGAGGISATGKMSGAWLNIRQGLRITVLDKSGNVSFTCNGKQHLDILFSEDNLANNNVYGTAHKTAGSRLDVGSLSELKSVNLVMTKSAMYAAFINGQLETSAPGGTKAALARFNAIPMHTVGNEGTNGYTFGGEEIKAKMYGTGDEIDDDAALYAIMNAKTGKGTFLWQPTGGIDSGDLAKLNSGDKTMMEVMGDKEAIISVEPIIWNRMRDDSGFTNIAMYGTHTDIGFACKDQMIPNGILKGGTKDVGGWDIDLIAKGRKAMVTTKALAFDGFTVQPPTGFTNDTRVTNAQVANKTIGWSLHLYRLNPKEDEPDIPTTSTCDEPDHPIEGNPPKRKPHPSQDPYEPDDPNFDKPNGIPETDHVEPGKDPYTHYRIVKYYETQKYKADKKTLVKKSSDGTYITDKTNPIVKIQDEAVTPDEWDGSWHLKDWVVSDQYPSLPEFYDDLKKGITSKDTGTKPAEVDLIDENDEEKVVTLYVHLLRKIKEDKTEEEETSGTGNIIIQQSQISKTIHTNDPSIGNAPWGNYTFKTQPAANFTLGGF